MLVHTRIARLNKNLCRTKPVLTIPIDYILYYLCMEPSEVILLMAGA